MKKVVLVYFTILLSIFTLPMAGAEEVISNQSSEKTPEPLSEGPSEPTEDTTIPESLQDSIIELLDLPKAEKRIQIEFNKATVFKSSKPIIRVSVTNPKIADVRMITNNQVLIVSMEEVGATNMMVWYDDNDAEVYDIEVYVPGVLVENIQAKIREIVPEADVYVTRGKDKIILYGTVPDLDLIPVILGITNAYIKIESEDEDAIVNLIRVEGSHQVQLEVVVAEVNRTSTKEMGLGFLLGGDQSIGVFSGGTISSTLSTDNSSSDLDSDDTDTDATSTIETLAEVISDIDMATPFSSAFQILVHSVEDNILGILSIMKSQGLSKTLANPTLVTMTGQEASFQVGGSFPIPSTDQNGTVQISYVEYGILLNFTPVVVKNDLITLKIAPEISEPDYGLGITSGGVAVPGLTKNLSSTTLQLKDGQTFVMAGLLKEDISLSVSKIPFLGDIPILGTLFTSKEYKKQESELVIVVTPHLVKPIPEGKVPPLPGDDLELTLKDTDFFLLNAQQFRKKNAQLFLGKKKDGPEFSGEHGFAK